MSTRHRYPQRTVVRYRIGATSLAGDGDMLMVITKNGEALDGLVPTLVAREGR